MSQQKDIFDFIEAVKEAADCLGSFAVSKVGHPESQYRPYEYLARRLNAGLARLIEGALGPEDAKLVREICLANRITSVKCKETEATDSRIGD